MNFFRIFSSFIILIILLPIQMFSQVRYEMTSRSSHLMSERIYSDSIPDKQVKYPSELGIFKDRQVKTIVNNTNLDNGFLLTKEIAQSWKDLKWVNGLRFTSTYDANNNMIEDLYQEWENTNWMNIRKYTFTYDANNNRIERLYQEWDGSNWVNVWKFKITYDANNNMIEWLVQYWEGYDWVNSQKDTRTYDTNNNMIESINQYWDGSNWVNSWRGLYTYIPATGNDELIDAANYYSLFQNYPNPFNTSTTIEFDLPRISDVTLKIYNILGEEVATLVSDRLMAGSHSYEWSRPVWPPDRPAGVASGVYLYRLSVVSITGETGDFVETRKMVLIR